MSNQGRLDGLEIDIYDGRFGGSFDMDTEVGQTISYDDVVTFMVVAVAGKANFDTNKSGDLKRTNVFEVTNVQIVPDSMAVKMANELNVLVPGVNGGQLTLTGPSVTASFDDEEEDEFVPASAPANGDLGELYDDKGWA